MGKKILAYESKGFTTYLGTYLGMCCRALLALRVHLGLHLEFSGWNPPVPDNVTKNHADPRLWRWLAPWTWAVRDEPGSNLPTVKARLPGSPVSINLF